jgi:hypothetical protein
MISKERFYVSETRETIGVVFSDQIQSEAEFNLIKEDGAVGVIDEGRNIRTLFCPYEYIEFLEDIAKPTNTSRFYQGSIFTNPYGIEMIQFSTPLGENDVESRKLLTEIFGKIDLRFFDSKTVIMWRENPSSLPHYKYEFKAGRLTEIC